MAQDIQLNEVLGEKISEPAPDEYDNYYTFFRELLEVLDSEFIVLSDGSVPTDGPMLEIDETNNTITVGGDGGTELDLSVDEASYHVLQVSGENQIKENMDMGGNNVENAGTVSGNTIDASDTLRLPGPGSF